MKEAAKKMFWIGLIIGAIATVVGGWIFLVRLFKDVF